MDRINDLNLAWLYVAVLTVSAIGAGIGWLATWRRR
jgi:hypothetical protein